MKSNDFLIEGIVEDAHEMHLDHEVQMAREECYHAAESAIALHKLLRHMSEQQGLEGWVSAKITLANDYLKTVREYLEYELMSGHLQSTPTEVVHMAEDTITESDLAPVVETTGVTDYNPKTQGGTRKELLAKYAKSQSSKDAEAARRAGATQKELQSARKSVSEGAAFGSNYAEQLAQQVFDANPNLSASGRADELLNAGYAIAKQELGKKANGIFNDEDFPSDFVSSYSWLQKQQGVAEGSDEKQSFKVTYHNPKTRQDKVVKIKAHNKDEVLDYCANKGYKNVHVEQNMAEGEVYDLDKEYGAPAPRKAPYRNIGGTSPRRHPDDPDFMDPDQRRIRAERERIKKANAEYFAKQKQQGMSEAKSDDPDYDEALKRFKKGLPPKKKSMEEGKQQMSRAAKGVMKYGKDGMKALAKAGREGASEKKLDAIRDKHDHYNESIAEGTDNIGNQIKALYQKIYDQGDDAIEFMYYDSPIFAQYWDEYEGDLDSIIAEVDPKELQVIHDELVSAAEDQGINEGTLRESDSPVAGAITRRILLQRHDLLSKYGPVKVTQAIDDVADFVGDVDEIGSSDVSGWVRQVEQSLADMGEGVNKHQSSISQGISETSAGSVAGVVNPTPKNKAKVGSLFGGTYKQKKAAK